MSVIALAGIGLVVWGLVTLDWVRIATGVVAFLAAAAWDYYKKRAAFRPDVFTVYQPLHKLVHVADEAIRSANAGGDRQKIDVARALLFAGMIDAASQGAGLSDKDFIALFAAVFQDMNYSDEARNQVIMFHQARELTKPGYAAIMTGGDLYTKFAKGRHHIIMTAGLVVQQFVDDPTFPTSISAL